VKSYQANAQSQPTLTSGFADTSASVTGGGFAARPPTTQPSPRRPSENPLRGPHGDFGLRLQHFDRFPYTVIYEPDDRLGPQIYAIAHQHREPGYWLSRI
jgi:hypothetical protein